MKVPESFRISSGPLARLQLMVTMAFSSFRAGTARSKTSLLSPVKGKAGSTFRCRGMLRTLSHALS